MEVNLVRNDYIVKRLSEVPDIDLSVLQLSLSERALDYFCFKDISSFKCEFIGSYYKKNFVNLRCFDLLLQIPSELFRNNKYNNLESLLNRNSRIIQDFLDISTTFKSTINNGYNEINFNNTTIRIIPSCYQYYNSTEFFVFIDPEHKKLNTLLHPLGSYLRYTIHQQTKNNKITELSKLIRMWRDRQNLIWNGHNMDKWILSFIREWTKNNDLYCYHDYMVLEFFIYLIKRTEKNFFYSYLFKENLYPIVAIKNDVEKSLKLIYEAVNSLKQGDKSNSSLIWSSLIG